MNKISVWNDIRTDVTVDQILARLPDQNKDHFKAISGLTISPYFSALKLRWLKDNIPEVRKACREGRCLAGTIDTWLIWVCCFFASKLSANLIVYKCAQNLTGGVNGGQHVTDVTNASRTLLMNIETLNWDPLLTKTFSIHPNMLPEIRSSSEIIGPIQVAGHALDGIRICAVWKRKKCCEKKSS